MQNDRNMLHAKRPRIMVERSCTTQVDRPEDRWPANSPDLNLLDYCIWDELVEAMNWNQVTSKQTLIEELKRGCRKVRSDVVFESCNSWTARLLKVSKNNEKHLNK
ncbi:unnamed protein product [Rotaria magnacalcarata]|uniref:Uncharacterized protein n=1 Tax=Rotaria magnacalcarata TaxID=392030 RepID=A0A816LVL7_9BILA|nr:unnamed protein product [Rotaria magnacalcarata]CAF4334093.1 unnamed protein product [Rotaria magnacalcarata]